MVPLNVGPPPKPRFLEFNIVGGEKLLYLPSYAVLSYEEVPKDKNESHPEGGSFIRYDVGEGLAFVMVKEKMDFLKQEIGYDNFITTNLLDGPELLVRKDLIISMIEVEDEGIDATKLTVNMCGQLGSLFVSTPASDIMAQGL